MKTDAEFMEIAIKNREDGDYACCGLWCTECPVSIKYHAFRCSGGVEEGNRYADKLIKENAGATLARESDMTPKETAQKQLKELKAKTEELEATIEGMDKPEYVYTVEEEDGVLRVYLNGVDIIKFVQGTNKGFIFFLKYAMRRPSGDIMSMGFTLGD